MIKSESSVLSGAGLFLLGGIRLYETACVKIDINIYHINNQEIMSALTDLRELANRQTAAIAGVRGDIQRLKEIVANNPNGINEEGVNELRGLFTANAEALEQLDAETTEETPPGEEEQPQG